MTCKDTEESGVEESHNDESMDSRDEDDEQSFEETCDDFDESEECEQLSAKLDEIASFMDELEERNELLKQQLRELLVDLKNERDIQRSENDQNQSH